jgi:hypothetical protein
MSSVPVLRGHKVVLRWLEASGRFPQGLAPFRGRQNAVFNIGRVGVKQSRHRSQIWNGNSCRRAEKAVLEPDRRDLFNDLSH